MIKISVPNDDHVALRAMAKALEEIAVARGATPTETPVDIGSVFNSHRHAFMKDLSEATRVPEHMLRGEPKQADVDTTSQQIESLSGRFATPDELEKIDETLRNAGVDENTSGHSVLMTTPPTTDSTGTPWDDRIHSASKALNADGTWRVRRKPADKTPEEWADYIKWVEEDIHTVQHGESDDVGHPMRDNETPEQFLSRYSEADAVHDEQEPSVTPQGDDFHVDAGEVTEQEVASIPAPPPPPPPVFATVQEVDEMLGLEPSYTFPQVMQFLTERHGRITSPQVDQIIADMGLNSIMDIRDNTEHAGPFIARVKALLGE